MKTLLRANPVRLVARAWRAVTRPHYLPSKLLKVVPGVTPGTQADDAALVRRIVANYARGVESNYKTGDSMWTDFFVKFHADIHQTLIGGSLEAAQAIFRNPKSNNLLYGFDNLAVAFKDANDGKQAAMARSVLEDMVRFAEAIGARRLYGGPTYRRWSPIDTKIILEEIEACLGLTLDFPNPFPGEVGAKTGKGVISFRVMQSLYQAWKLKTLLQGKPNPKILEIGGGLGRTAYYANRFGLKDYTLVDLPLSLAAQAYFLGRVLTNDHIAYNNEAAFAQADMIKLFTIEDFLACKTKFDIILNADSITEMDKSVAVQYSNKIKENCSIFLSINHETNAFLSRDLFSKEFALRKERNLYWMRPGYVEEIYYF